MNKTYEKAKKKKKKKKKGEKRKKDRVVGRYGSERGREEEERGEGVYSQNTRQIFTKSCRG